MSQRGTAASTGRLRRRSVRRRSTSSTLAKVILAATVITSAFSHNAAATSAETLLHQHENASVPVPLEFVPQCTATPLPVKRRRQKQIDQLDEPLQTKNLSLGRAMMKRDRLLQQIWKKSQPTDAERIQIAIRLQEINKVIGALEKDDTPTPTPDQVVY